MGPSPRWENIAPSAGEPLSVAEEGGCVFHFINYTRNTLHEERTCVASIMQHLLS